MNIQAVLTTLKKAGTRVLLKDGKLKVQTKQGPLKPEIKALIVEHKPALMAFLQKAETAKAAKARQTLQTIKKAEPAERIVLSHAQQRLWLMDKLGAEGATYLINMALMLDGELNVDALKASFDVLFERHDILRTVFVEDNDDTWQVKDLQAELCFEVHQTAENNVKPALGEKASRAMSLTDGPLFEVHLFAINDNRHGLLIRLHHIIADGWSMGVLVQELTECYAALSTGNTPQLAPLDIQYHDYAIWQRTEVNEEGLKKQQAFWLDLLEGAPKLLTLPYDRARPAVQTYNGKVYSKTVYPEVYHALNNLAQLRSTTLYVPMMVCYAVMLAKFSGQSDIVMGAPFAGRSNKQLESLIGFFVSTGALRVQPTGDKTLSQLIDNLKEQLLKAQANQDVAFEEVVEKLAPKRDLSYSPIFQVMFDLEKAMAGTGDDSGEGLQITPMDSTVEVAKFDLTLNLNESADGITAFFEYNTDLFDQSTIVTMAEAYVAIAQAMVNNPDIRVDDIALGNPEQAMCGPVVDRELDLMTVFETVVSERGDAIAIEGREGKWSYDAFNQRIDQLAWQLREQGVVQGDRVAIFLERSNDMMASALAALKLGAVYLPIDAGYPSERVSHMLFDAQPKVLLTDSGLSRPDAIRDGLQTVVVDVDSMALSDNVEPLPLANFSPITGAYLMYTSGSTGKPKGVLINRRAVLNHALHMAKTFRVTPDDRALQFSSFSFDIAVEELYSTLLSGATLVLYNDNLGLGLAEFEQYVSDTQVSIVNLPTAYWHLWANHATNCDKPFVQPNVRLVIVGGEAARFDCLESWQQSYPNIRWLNTYGPTETTVTASIWDNEGQDIYALAQPQIPLGEPLSNGRLYVLDEAFNPVPPGVTGKLYIGGLALANGYWHQPAKTVEVFLPDPFAKTPGARMYDTGDLVRVNHLGDIEYKGRADYQVKIRGFRIEPDEVANVLKGCDGVKDAVVLAVSLGEVGKQLIGYAACEDGVTQQNLKSQLNKQLPDYMVPSQIVVLAELPLTANGKIDRKALPEPSAEVSEMVAPKGETEQLLHEHWSALLGREQISVTDNFFELGGHSLLAVQLVSRVRETFSIDFHIKTLFESPTIADLAIAINDNQNQSESYQLTVLPEGETPVLSYAQQRLWFLDQLESGSTTYNMPMAMRLKGDINYQALENSFKRLVARHEALRTTFVEVDGQATIVVADVDDWQMQYESLAGRDVPDRVDAFSSEVFNLTDGPLFKVLVITESEHSVVLAMNLHHIIGDGWSFGILGRELSMFYHCEVTGESDNLAPLPIQYSDYAYWQRKWLEDGELERQLGYWRDKMAGSVSLLELPTDRMRPAVQSYRGSLYVFDMAPELARQVQSKAREQGCTPYMVWLAGFKVLLALYSRQRDIIVGSPTANRGRTEIEGIIGFFVNTLVLRDELAFNQSFDDLLTQVKTTVLDAQAHQDVPFEQLVEVLQPDRSLSYSPLFQVCFDVFSGNASGQEGLELPNLDAQAISEGEHRIAKFDLMLNVQQHDAGASASLEYSTDLFDLDTIEQMMNDFQKVMEVVTSRGQKRLDCIVLSDEKAAVPFAAADYEAWPDMLHGFSRQAAKQPDATAVHWHDGHGHDETLSYSQLDRLSTKLSHYLREQGVTEETFVAVCMARTPSLLVALQAVLKSGGAYVPLDPKYPQSRSQQIIDSAKPLVLLTDDSAPELNTDAKVVLDTQWQEQIGAYSDSRIEVNLSAERLAYVIYTSGSTGVPKGVSISHANAAAMIQWAGDFYERVHWRKVAAVTSVCFDLSVYELFAPLSFGGSIAIVDDAMDIRSAGSDVTLVNTVPSALKTVINEGWFPPETLVVNVAGEPLPQELAEATLALDCQPQLFNLYGPSEDTTYSTWSKVKAGQAPDIGVPLPGTHGYILDEALNPVARGVAGVLYLSGPGVTRGYLGQGGQTAGVYLPDPFADEPGQRMYNTNDLVRLNKAGQLEYVGRADHQVKIRGFRIEPGEVAVALKACDGVKESVVIPLEMGAAGKQLVGYITADDTMDSLKLKLKVGETLPDYMVPAHIVQLDAMPLTANGKIDRKALPAPSIDQADMVEPVSEVEQQLHDIWCVLLGQPKLSVTANFFSLGGHSLLAVQLTSRVRETFDIDFQVKALFEAPTIRALAARIADADSASAQYPLSRLGDDVAKPLSFTQQRLWFLDRLEGGSTTYNMPMAMRLKGTIDVNALSNALHDLVLRHDSLRMTFAESEGQAWLRVNDGHQWKMLREEISQEELGTESIEQRVARFSSEIFDLTDGPLFKALLIEESENTAVLAMNLHHIIADGWSLGILGRELSELYCAHVAGISAQLPELPVDYSDYAYWQRQWLEGGELARQMSYWEMKLSGAVSLLELPTDNMRPPVQSYRGALMTRELPNDLVEQVSKLAQNQGCTAYMVWLAGFKWLLAMYSGQRDIIVGTPSANRNRVEIEGLIGFFVNSLVLRDEIDWHGRFVDLLGQVRETVLDAQAHQDVPFEQLVDALQPNRSLSYSPLYQVSFDVFTGIAAGQEALSLPNLTVETVSEGEHTTAKFDLMLNIQQGEQGATAFVEYATDLFEADTIDCLLADFLRLLNMALNNPNIRLDDVSLADETAHVPYHEAQWPAWPTMTSGFEAMAKQCPEAVAFYLGDDTLSYRALDERSNQLARALRGKGLGPGSFVGICMSRHLDLPVCLYGIVKSGAAYVPLDPKYPQSRIQQIVDSAKPALVIVDDSAPDFDVPGEHCHYQSIETADFSVEPLEVLQPDSALAYVIYTSGSTGVPKGVSLTHGNAVALFGWAGEVYSREELTKVAGITSICFDLSIYELFAPQSHGGATVIMEDALSLGHSGRDITLFSTVPSALRAVLEQGWLPETTKVVQTAGELMPTETAELFYATMQNSKLYNLYGPSEDTTYSTGSLVVPGTIPHIGQTFPGTHGYILDAGLNMVPRGVAGVLYLAGLGVTRGYLNQPGITAAAYIPDPFSSEPGARMYNSGDLVRLNRDGNLEFVGRADFQVKIRGFRIEPDEIAARLKRIEGVDNAVVVPLDTPGGKQLAGYVASLDDKVDEAFLKARLSSVLPDYMVPAAIVVMEALPLTTNGKIDRKNLPAPNFGSKGYVAPANDHQLRLQAIWQTLLHQDELSIEANFFDVGGHSLLAVQLISRIADDFAVQLPLSAVFELPTIEAMAQRIAESEGEQVIEAIPRLAPDSQKRLSFAQQRLWFIDQLVGGDSTYNMPMVLNLSGHIDAHALEKAFKTIVLRHEALRSNFVELNGEPQVVIGDGLQWHMAREVVSDWPEENIKQAVNAFCSGVFKLSSDPLFKVLLLQQSDDKAILVVNIHHIVCDGWSLQVLGAELTALYSGLVEGIDTDLPELPIQYSDFALWQRDWLEGGEMARQLDYWQHKLADLPTLLELPTDRVRPAEQTFNGGVIDRQLPAELGQGVRQLARQIGGTDFMVWLAGFKVMLSAYSGQRDITVGSPTANRNRREIEGLIGFFVNTLVLRDQLQWHESFEQLLRQVKETVVEAQSHQDVPFEQLVDVLNVERSLSHTPLYQVAFDVFSGGGDVGDAAMVLPGLKVDSGEESEQVTAKFDLTLKVGHDDSGAQLSLEYNSDLFDRETAEKLVAQYIRLMDHLINQPAKRLDLCPLVSPGERQWLKQHLSGEIKAYDGDIISRFEAIVETHGSRVAVEAADSQWSYLELNARANQLAQLLLDEGVKVGQTVAIYLDRCKDRIATLLAALKVGAVFLPVDANFSKSRVEYMFDDACAQLVLSRGELYQNPARRVIDLDALPVSKDVQFVSTELVDFMPAYVMYTSGSTGKPKGATNRRGSLLNYALHMRDLFKLKSQDKVLQFGSLSFDIMIQDIFPTLMAGGAIVLYDDSLGLGVAEYEQYLAQKGVTSVNIPAAYMHLWIDHLPHSKQSLPDLRVVYTGGEAADYDKWCRWLEAKPQVLSVNAYGPTEATVATSMWLSSPQKLSQIQDKRVPIGECITNGHLYILDESFNPVARGALGQLYIGGCHVADGYRNLTRETAKHFLPDPFNGEGSRMYATGDVVRLNNHDELVYVGRSDDQLKIRGFRVELGEITTVMNQHPSVRQGMVIAIEQDGDKQLAAYVVIDVQTDVADLRNWLAEQLPDYMVPASFTVLDTLPLTVNGKVDKKALPAPDFSAQSSVAAESETELSLQQVFAEVLKVEEPSVTAGFFELGGHSLLAVQLISRINQQFEVDLTVKALFEAPTIRALSGNIERAEHARHRLPLLPSEQSQYPLSYAQQRLWFLDKLDSDSTAYHMPFPFEFKGPVNCDALKRTLKNIVERHEVLRTRFVEVDGDVIQQVDSAAHWSVMEQQVSQDELDSTISAFIAERFDLSQGPLFKALLLKVSNEHHVLVINKHHIISDGWSVSVLGGEMTEIYSHLINGTALQLPELSVQYKDYAHWQRQWLDGGELERQLNYWQHKLDDLPALLELPYDRARPVEQRFVGDLYNFDIDSKVLAKVRDLAKTQGCTTYMVWLAAFKVLLGIYSGQRDIVVGSPTANRNHPALENLIGFFVNTLVYRDSVDMGKGFDALLNQVRETVLDAQTNQDVPFEQLVDVVNPERSLSYTPLFQVCFDCSVEGASEEQPSLLPGVEVSTGGNGEHQVAKFDLTLDIIEQGDKVSGSIEYSTDLFEQSTMVTFAGHFNQLLVQVLDDVTQPLDKVVLTDSVDNGLLIGKSVDLTDEDVIVRFEQQVTEQGAQTAVVDRGTAYSYQLLSERVDRLCALMHEQGVSAGDRVAIFVPRCVDMVASALAVLKLGACYLPIDAGYPSDRVAYMIEDNQPKLVLCLSDQPLDSTVPTLLLDEVDHTSAAAPWPRKWVSPVTPAYIMYTSGSTGKPKGVVVNRIGVVNEACAMAQRTQLTSRDAQLQFSSFSFDIAVEEMYSTLCHGAALVLYDDSLTLEISAFVDYVKQQKVTVANLPTAYWHLWADHAANNPVELNNLRLVIVGGEAASFESLAKWQLIYPQVQWLNTYGPTEGTIAASHWMSGDDELDNRQVPLGNALNNYRLYILDERLNPVPAGVSGQLFIAGPGVANGYWRRPGQTADVFLPDLYAKAPGERMYATGDRGRLSRQGRLEYLGRTDFQVKIRGFRIEPDEVANVLRGIDGVDDAVVIAVTLEGVGKQLVAYVADSTLQANESELKVLLGKELPEFMVPAQIMVIKAMPLSKNGKIDRKALPDPSVEVGEYVAPRNETEATLQQQWMALLGRDVVSVTANFFELGGHSLLAVQLTSRIVETFGVDFKVKTLFEAPSIRALSDIIDNAAEVVVNYPLTPLDAELPRPMSFAQQRLWFLDKLEGPSNTYHMPMAMKLSGDVNVAALERTFKQLITRQQALRSYFVEVEGGAQLALLDVDDWTLAVERCEPEQAQAKVTAFFGQMFDLSRGPLFKAMLLLEDDENAVLAINMHHIISDGWSMGILGQEMSLFYNSAVTGEPVSLSQLPIQYSDYAYHQREWLEGGELARQLTYWRNKMSGAVSLLELPTDRLRPASQSYRGDMYHFDIDSELLEGVNNLAFNNGCTAYMVWLAGFKWLLAMYSGQRDIIVGSPTANRGRTEVEGLIGFFVNSLVLRDELKWHGSFAELLMQVRETVLDAQAHQDVPFEQLVDELQPQRSLSYSPLFQVCFDVFAGSASGQEGLQLPGLSVSGFGEEGHTVAKFDMMLNIEQSDEVVGGSVEYATDLFDRATIEKMMNGYLKLMSQALKNPQVRLDEVSLADEAALVKYQQPQWPVYQGILDRFAGQVSKQPEAIALIHGQREMTYAELDRQSAQLAHYLMEQGVEQGSFVGVCMARTPELVVALQAVIKTGSAYVPLDPAYPQSRIEQIVAGSQPTLLLTDNATPQFDSGSEVAQVRAISLEHWQAQLGDFSTKAPDITVHPDALAYVIYTSGSTGVPKGVAISHGNAQALLGWAGEFYPQGSWDKVAAVTSICFDLSVYELFAPLGFGGTIMLFDDALALEHAPNDISLINTVPSALKTVIEQGWFPEKTAIVNVAGEPLPFETSQMVLSQPCKPRLFNLYGPSEDTTYSTCSEVKLDTVPNIGLPLPGSWAYILDEALNPVAQGAAGVLYLAGLGLSRGYLGRPELTADVYLPDPFSQTPGGRMYNTGDLVRLDHNGDLVYIGRADHQVKIRGFRIEPDEIAVALKKCDGVENAVVIPFNSPQMGKQLVGYVATSDNIVSELGLKSAIGEKLPDYMIPAHIVLMSALPLTANGKIDRKALPEPTFEVAEYVAPTSVIETDLQDLWQQVLGIEPVSVTGNFFELGGHSLLAVQMVSRIRQTFNVDVQVKSLFEAPTVRALAAVVERADTTISHYPLKPLTDIHKKPISYAQQRLWFLDKLEGGSTTYNMPMAMRLSGSINVEVLGESLKQLVLRQQALRLRFAESDSHAELVIDSGEDWSMAVEHIDVDTIKSRVGEFAQEIFNLSTGPLFKALYLLLDDNNGVLVLNMHHIISDGWSLAIIGQEMSMLYNAGVTGEAIELPELPIQYSDYAYWQRKWLEEGELDRQMGYWRDKLDGVVSLLELPTDRMRPATQSYNGAMFSFDIPDEVSQGVNRLATAHGCTAFMVYLAGFKWLLAMYSGQRDIVVGTPSANRNRTEIEGLVGFFVNSLVLRDELKWHSGFDELLLQVRETVLDAQAHQDVPFEQLVDALQPTRSLSYSPLFQVCFDLFAGGASGQQSMSLPDLTVDTMDDGAHTVSKFDMMLNIAHSDWAASASVEYCVDLFDESTVEQMMQSFIKLMKTATESVQIRLDSISVAEQDAVVTYQQPDWQGGHTMLSRFSCQVAKTPGQIALVCGEQLYTYRDLDSYSTRLAHYLAGQGVGPGQLVGVCMSRSAYLVMALQAVIKTGAAYVPLDPEYPRSRIEQIVDSSQPCLLLIDDAAPMAALDGRARVHQSQWLAQLPHYPDSELAVDIQGDALAYVIYTSGSTGVPKGVSITHANAAALIGWAGEFYPENAWQKVAAVTSICFDLSIFELFAPVSHGGQIVLLDNALALKDAPEDISLVNTVPSALRTVIEQGWFPQNAAYVNVAGEPLPVETADMVHQLPSKPRLFNLYGPSEDTTYSTCSEVKPGIVPDIGLPLPGTKAYILDEGLNPVARGAAGVLYLAGIGVSRGYLGKPELTAGVYLPDPFATTPGERMYNTNDLVRLGKNGQLIYVGRADHQVKIRGFRIEPDEIAVVLKREQGVDNAVVVPVDSPNGKELVAYVATRDVRISEAQLKLRLAEQLPDYMIPALIVLMADLPLTANGKIDRKALPSPQFNTADYVAPKNDLESAMQNVWQQVLERETVSVEDNFFEIGGHSLLAVKLISQVNQQLELSLNLLDLYRSPTIRKITDTGTVQALGENLVQLHTGNTGRNVFSVHPVGGDIFSYYGFDAIYPNWSIFGLQRSELNQEKLVEFYTIETLADQYVNQLIEIQPEGGYHFLAWSLGGTIVFEMCKRLKSIGKEVASVRLIDHAPVTEKEQNEFSDWLGSIGLDFSLEPEVLTFKLLEDESLHAGVDEFFNLAQQDVDEKTLAKMRALSVANFVARMHYIAEGKVEAQRVILSMAQQTVDDMDMNRTRNWFEQHYVGTFDFEVLPGDHFSIMDAQSIARMTKQ